MVDSHSNSKSKGDLRGIGLVEVLWKSILSLLNCQLRAAISFHDTLHGFRAGRGTGVSALESKILQQLTAISEAVLLEIFLDLWKDYNTLDRERELYLLTAYRVGPRTVRLLQTYWYQLTVVAKAGGYFGRPFKGQRCVMQGDPLSPHDLQRGRGRRYPPLGNGGDYIRGKNRGTWSNDH